MEPFGEALHREWSKWSLIRIALTAGLAGACSSSSPPTPAAPLIGRHSFDVVATVKLSAEGDPACRSEGFPFTLVLDADAGLAIVGARGTAAESSVTNGANGELGLGALSIDAPLLMPTTLDFTSLRLAASATALSGTGTGTANVFCIGCPSFSGPFTVTVSGTPDATPPALVGAGGIDPFGSVTVTASEPLPATSTARLVAEDGTTMDLVPTVLQGDVPLVVGFESPKVVFPIGTGFSIPLDQIVDLAGLHGAADTPLRFAPIPTPPLVAGDGFESAAGTTLGGATVVSGGPLAPIAGTHSVYIGPNCAPSPTGGAAAQELLVRLAVSPGATKVVFSYELVGPGVGAGDDMPSAFVSAGSVGKMLASAEVPAAKGYVMQTPWPNGQTWNVGDVNGMELALPDVTSEVLVEIRALVRCGAPVGFSDGILIDDLRLE